MVSTLLILAGYVLLGELVLLGLATAVFIDGTKRAEARRHATRRLRERAPWLGILVGVLVVNKLVRDVIPEISWLIGWNITPVIHRFEGALVADLQSVATPTATLYFSFVYIYGYVFLLVFPFIVYLALEDHKPMQTTAAAYTLNYALGLLLYVLFVSYGPRNLIPDLVQPLLYNTFPQSQILTSAVNTNTNVFPSLHTSLSVTAAGLAYLTREQYPAWAVTAAVLAVSITAATMYLGIHWVSDVVAGVALGVLCLVLARRFVTRRETE
ncbi:phosphatase PAP2 family protein [Haloferax namakaokahaiae]|uniref:Phosphatase PAP2 family protein n=1 Tax=Haloferax namakaokahaiae TaxID=1748331 RepID=A0ABD5ZI01_9EURY